MRARDIIYVLLYVRRFTRICTTFFFFLFINIASSSLLRRLFYIFSSLSLHLVKYRTLAVAIIHQTMTPTTMDAKNVYRKQISAHLVPSAANDEYYNKQRSVCTWPVEMGDFNDAKTLYDYHIIRTPRVIIMSATRKSREIVPPRVYCFVYDLVDADNCTIYFSWAQSTSELGSRWKRTGWRRISHAPENILYLFTRTDLIPICTHNWRGSRILNRDETARTVFQRIIVCFLDEEKRFCLLHNNNDEDTTCYIRSSVNIKRKSLLKNKTFESVQKWIDLNLRRTNNRPFRL